MNMIGKIFLETLMEAAFVDDVRTHFLVESAVKSISLHKRAQVQEGPIHLGRERTGKPSLPDSGRAGYDDDLRQWCSGAPAGTISSLRCF